MFIIGISGKAEAGKTTFANFLKQALERKHYRVLLINYGDYVKFIAEKYYNWNGNKNEYGRALLQHIGTEQGRISVYENIWVDMVIRTVQVAERDYDIAIIADCRFQNEFDRWNDFDYDIMKIRIERPEYENKLTEEQRKHSSETSLDNYDFDATIINNGNLNELEDLAESFANEEFEDGIKN